jgi:hypothetical protein
MVVDREEAGSCGRRQEEEVDNALYPLSLLPGPSMGRDGCVGGGLGRGAFGERWEKGGEEEDGRIEEEEITRRKRRACGGR